MTLNEILDQIWVMPEESREELQKYIHEVSFPKGYNLMGIDKVETSVYFVKKELSGPMCCRMVMKLPFGLKRRKHRDFYAKLR